MLLVIPLIALHNGCCYFKIRGESGTERYYFELSEKPYELCKLWRRENAKSLHVSDFDSMFNESKHDNFELILQLSKAVDIPMQVLSGFKNVGECAKLLENGIQRIVIFDLALIDPQGVKELIKKYTPSRVSFFVNAIYGRVNFWDKTLSMSETDYFSHLRELGATRILYRDDGRFDSGEGPDIEVLKNVATISQLRVTVFGSIITPEHLWKIQELEPLGIDSVIIGRPLYENNFPCQKIWRLTEKEEESK
ncbi:MAG: HisA/HisF-related TIM barrel protein [Bacteroidota bacterium]